MFYGHRGFTEEEGITAFIPDSPVPDSVLEPRWDEARQMIAIACSGIWTPQQIDACFTKLEGLIDAMRSRASRVRVLVDRRCAVPQPPETIERLRTHTYQGYLPEDRVAVVVDSSLSKQQLRDQLDLQTHKLFLSEHAALLWITAHD